MIETTLGLTHARLRGIRESRAGMLIFVDDDNLLDESYLSNALSLAEKMPYIGAFGGHSEGDFESTPPTWIQPYLGDLVIRNVFSPRWSCMTGTASIITAPAGAGLVIRSSIANFYLDKVVSDPIRKKLDRRGGNLMSGGDTDMALCACELNFGIGLFPELKLRHIIPSERTSLEYMLRLTRGLNASYYILRYLWDGEVPAASQLKPTKQETLARIIRYIKSIGKVSESDRVRYLIEKARRNGCSDALKIIHESTIGL